VAGGQRSRNDGLPCGVLDRARQHVIAVGLDEREEQRERRYAQKIAIVDDGSKRITSAAADDLRRGRLRGLGRRVLHLARMHQL
jgi:hypothetical protein